MDGTVSADPRRPQPCADRQDAARVLFYTHGFVDGGAERLWAGLASAFHARGHAVAFATDFDATDNRAHLDAAIPVTILGDGHRAAIRRLARHLADTRPDVALSAVGGSNVKLLLALDLARVITRAGGKPALRTRAIISYHGFDEWRTGTLSRAAYSVLPLWSRRAARTIAVSNGLRDALITRWRADASRTITLHNPVQFPATAPVPTAAELSQRPPIILAAGRLVPDKDHLTLIRAFARVTHPGARLVILGKGPEQSTLEAEIARLGLSNRIELAGFAANPWRHYETARCFVSSSKSESFGNVLVEALAHGLPVVSTACTGPLEILDHGAHGELVPVGDVAALATAIDAALAEPAKLSPAKRRQRADAFSFDARLPAYLDLVDQVRSNVCVEARP
ncbi:MAG: glycosyltransferase [Hyphomicrobiaceae bacterium]|nr:glycosyltransferase [Hyphomicrobiaceae bacterium]